jgi:alpha-D-ribose 1-methylphosphonate 5-triphosphate synthase subunit PhnG
VAREQRKLAAVLAADVVGYSRLMGRDERLAQLALLAGLVRVRSCVDTTTARLLAQLQRSTCGGRGFRNSHSSLRQTEYASRPAWGSVTVIQSLSLADFITSSCWM